MQEPKILFFLCVWKRPEITELCFMGLQRLMKHGQAKTLAVISEKSMIPLCKKYGIDFIEHENQPLGRKKNAGLKAAMSLEWDYLIELGSDDLILDSIFEYYRPFMERGEDFFGANMLLFVDAIEGTSRSYTADEANYGYGWGLGRAASRKMIESFGGTVKVKTLTGVMTNDEVIPEGTISCIPKATAQGLEKQHMVEILADEQYYLWTDSAERMLDNDSSRRIMGKGFKYKVVETPEPIMADLKSDENLWGYNQEIGLPGDLERFLSQLSQKERTTFFNNQKKLRAKRIETAA